VVVKEQARPAVREIPENRGDRDDENAATGHQYGERDPFVAMGLVGANAYHVAVSLDPMPRARLVAALETIV
jgi:hypothetical protein